jgi:hypothetical protein
MEPEFMSDALDDLRDDDGYAPIDDPGTAPVRYREGNHVVDDGAYCMGVMLRMLFNRMLAQGYQPTEAQARGVRAHLNRAGLRIGGE